MKLQRWDYLHLHGDPLIRRDDGDYCASKDVARLEARLAMIEQEHFDLMDLHETIMRGAPIEVIRREAEELQKRFLENRP